MAIENAKELERALSFSAMIAQRVLVVGLQGQALAD
jgi:hypothetical protein